jgi:hypothetical protein
MEVLFTMELCVKRINSILYSLPIRAHSNRSIPISGTHIFKMCRTASEQAFPDESLTEQHFNVLLCPFTSGKSLQEHHYALEIHFQELFGPFG